MDDIINNLKTTFRRGSILTRLIYINVGIFLVIRIAGIICTLFNTNIDWMLQYLEFPASPENFLRRHLRN